MKALTGQYTEFPIYKTIWIMPVVLLDSRDYIMIVSIVGKHTICQRILYLQSFSSLPTRSLPKKRTVQVQPTRKRFIYPVFPQSHLISSTVRWHVDYHHLIKGDIKARRKILGILPPALLFAVVPKKSGRYRMFNRREGSVMDL